ncbi:MAG: flagellar basal body L-ring protein FlgH [Candidatus Anammoxibacter sp.]
MYRYLLIKRNAFSKLACILCGAIFSVAILQVDAQCDSLWTKRVMANTNLFADNRAMHVGDTVTVIISEKTDILGVEDNELDAETNFSSEIDASNFFVGSKRTEEGIGASLDKFLPNITGNHSTGFEAEGEYESTRDINFRLTAMVTEVLGNGNLLIEGKRRVSVNGESYTLRVSGIIRPIDIDANNVVLSEKMANANISLNGKGFLTRNAKRGWGYRVIDVFWPF